MNAKVKPQAENLDSLWVHATLEVEVEDIDQKPLGTFTRPFVHAFIGCKPCNVRLRAADGSVLTADIEYVTLEGDGLVIYQLDEDDFDSPKQARKFGFKLVPGTAPKTSPRRKRVQSVKKATQRKS